MNPELELLTLETKSLGNRSYLLFYGDIVVAIDVQRDIDRFKDEIQSRGAKLVAVCETHFHNDYLSGGLSLSRQYGAEYLVPFGPKTAYKATYVCDGFNLNLNGINLRAIETPGHTDSHFLYEICAPGNLQPMAFTGGSLLYGSVGRSDLLGTDRTESLIRAQHRSINRLPEILSEETIILPTHGFGSLCSVGDGFAKGYQLRDQMKSNLVFELSEDDFLEYVKPRLGNFPDYYKYMGTLNLFGYNPYQENRIRNLSFDELKNAQKENKLILDTRSRNKFSEGHLSKSINIEARTTVATWFGWLFPINEPIFLVVDSQELAQDVVTDLARIGVDQIQGIFVAESNITYAWDNNLHLLNFEELTNINFRDSENILLDVRESSEFLLCHIENAINLPLSEINKVDLSFLEDKNLFVHCQVGYRASLAVSYLKNFGLDVNLVNDEFPSDQNYPLIKAI
jgi:hydroxyacylglutathione hydrolase